MEETKNPQEAQITARLKTLESTYKMLTKTLGETVDNMKSKTNENGEPLYSEEKIEQTTALIKQSIESTKAEYHMLGGNVDNLLAMEVEQPKKKTFKKTTSSSKEAKTPPKTESKVEKPSTKATTTQRDIDYLASKENFDEEGYDLIPLPSKGEGYRSKKAKLPVASLTAYDENILVAPNLYRDNLVLDAILKQKILDDTVDPADLLEGDRETIILYLRKDGYGVEYPITATDDVTGKQFDTVVDLSQIKFRDFKLKGDENGWFDFTLPVCKKEVKFRFLSHRDNLDLQAMEEAEDKGLKKERILDCVDRLNNFLDSEKDLDSDEEEKVRTAIKSLEDWSDNIDTDTAQYTHAVTNRLEREIMSVDGITDRNYIHNFVNGMKVKDSKALRTYISDNEPGLDYNLTIEKPASLGGGSMNVFLQLDTFIFLNTTE